MSEKDELKKAVGRSTKKIVEETLDKGIEHEQDMASRDAMGPEESGSNKDVQERMYGLYEKDSDQIRTQRSMVVYIAIFTLFLMICCLGGLAVAVICDLFPDSLYYKDIIYAYTAHITSITAITIALLIAAFHRSKKSFGDTIRDAFDGSGTSGDQ
ncbi:MAG: hypothetical protein ACR2PR_03185 [Pseudohongiellaceae bacterium]